MAGSDITVSGLTTTGAVTQIQLSWTVNDPRAGAVPILALDAVEIWAAAVNDRSAAAKVTEGATSAIHSGIPGNVNRYYWIRARNNNGSIGAWYPASPTGGIVGTTATDVIVGGTISGGTITGATVHGGTFDAVGATINPPNGAAGLTINQGSGFSSIGLVIANAGLSPSVQIAASSFGMVLLGTHSGGGNILTLTHTGVGTVLAATHHGANHAISATHDGISGHSLALSRSGSPSSSYAVSSIRQGGGNYGVYSFKDTGGYAFYADVSGATGYGPFTGAHDGLLRKATRVEVGDVLCDGAVLFRHGVSDTITEVELSSAPRQRVPIGIFVSRRRVRFDDEISAIDDVKAAWSSLRRFDLAIVNAVGEGQINVCGENGAIAAGDLLVTSSIPGKAMRQDDDIVRSCTVARAREGAALATAGDRAQIACIYLCG
jgi:hypothetical protein